jgi:hypothetical protein
MPHQSHSSSAKICRKIGSGYGVTFEQPFGRRDLLFSFGNADSRFMLRIYKKVLLLEVDKKAANCEQTRVKQTQSYVRVDYNEYLIRFDL